MEAMINLLPSMHHRPSEDDVEELPWWTTLANEASGGMVQGVEQSQQTLLAFSRQCGRLFFQKKINKEIYFQCCCVGWMIQCLENNEDLTAADLWDAALSALQVAGDESCMAGWILPKVHFGDLEEQAKVATTTPSSSSRSDPEEQKMYLLVQLWKRFYKACEERDTIVARNRIRASRPFKRQRTTYQYLSSKSSSASSSSVDSLDGLLMKGAYKLPIAILLSSILLQCQKKLSSSSSWQDLHNQVHRLPEIFQTMTVDEIHAAMAVLGMQCLLEGTHVPGGLSPCLLLERYVTRMG